MHVRFSKALGLARTSFEVAVAVESCFGPFCMSTKALGMCKKQRSMFFEAVLFWNSMKACCCCVAQERGHCVK